MLKVLVSNGNNLRREGDDNDGSGGRSFPEHPRPRDNMSRQDNPSLRVSHNAQLHHKAIILSRRHDGTDNSHNMQRQTPGVIRHLQRKVNYGTAEDQEMDKG